MKKIYFNDRYELTNAVLIGRKTMTRRKGTWDSNPLVYVYSFELIN